MQMVTTRGVHVVQARRKCRCSPGHGVANEPSVSGLRGVHQVKWMVILASVVVAGGRPRSAAGVVLTVAKLSFLVVQ